MSTTAPRNPRTDDDAAIRRRRAIRAASSRRRWSPTKVAAVAAIVIVLAIGAEFALHVVRTDPRDARAITERELRVNTLRPGERVVAMTSAFERLAVDYFRATHGLLVLTNQRLLFLGLQPRELIASGDGPPTFEERDYPVDTLVRVQAGRTFFDLARAVVIAGPDGPAHAYGIPSPAWHDATLLIDSVAARHKLLFAEGVRQKRARDRAEAERRAAEAEARRAQYYVVQRGDALAAIAARWSTTPEQLRAWNKLPNNMIKIGQKLLVKPAP